MIGRSGNPEADLKRADELTSRALALNANYYGSNFVKGEVLRAEGRLNDAIAAYERALVLNPNFVLAHGSLGDTYSVLGQYEKAIEFLDRAIRLSPHDPSLYFWYNSKSWAYFALQQYDQAIEWARRSIAINPNFEFPNATLAAALALTGHETQARDAEQRRDAASEIKSIAAARARFGPPPPARTTRTKFP
jgi:adenylate cyclase